MKVLCGIATAVLVAATALAEPAGEVWRTRAVAKLNGVFSPRGFFNIVVRLKCIESAEWVKLDLKKAQITVDFAPGETVSAETVARVQREAGYRPGPVEILHLSGETIEHSAPGWMPLKPRPRKGSVSVRRRGVSAPGGPDMAESPGEAPRSARGQESAEPER